MQQLLFSVVIPAYNLSSYLGACVDSVLASQGGVDDTEIIIVDDGSTDDTGQVADSIAEKYGIVKVVHQSNQGLSMARNAGIDIADGEYLVFVDADDTLLPCALGEIRKAIAESNRPDAVAFKAKSIDNDNVIESYGMDVDFGELRTQSVLQMALKLLKDTRNNAACFYCVRTQFIRERELLFEKGLLGEDNEYTPRMLFAAKNIALCDAYCYLYRIGRAGSIITERDITFYVHYARIMALMWSKFHEGAKKGIYDETALETAEGYVRDTYFIAVWFASLYVTDARYGELLEELKKSSVVLNGSNEPKHIRYLKLIRRLGMKRGLEAFAKPTVRQVLVRTALWRKVLRPMRKGIHKALVRTALWRKVLRPMIKGRREAV